MSISNGFIKKIIFLMLGVFALVIFFDIGAWMRSSQKEAAYQNEKQAAQAAGYEEQFSVCTRKDPLQIDGVAYQSFSAYKADAGEGEYRANLLVDAKAEYADNAEGQKENLILFGKTRDTVTEGDVQYQVLELYSVCDYLALNDNGWGIRALVITIFVGFLELMMMMSLMLFTVWSRKKQV